MKQTLNVKPILPSERPFGTPVSRLAKVVLLNLDGSTSEIKLITPIFSNWAEPIELAYHPLCQYVESLTTRFINIIGYQISIGSIDENGNEGTSLKFATVEIPLNKVYKPGQGWINPSNKALTHE